ncbi:MAG: hypothetical protein AAB152_12745, partial [Candidatus Coatesbacteria bacterium]
MGMVVVDVGKALSDDRDGAFAEEVDGADGFRQKVGPGIPVGPLGDDQRVEPEGSGLTAAGEEQEGGIYRQEVTILTLEREKEKGLALRDELLGENEHGVGLSGAGTPGDDHVLGQLALTKAERIEVLAVVLHNAEGVFALRDVGRRGHE